jgi:hypothetical protein
MISITFFKKNSELSGIEITALLIWEVSPYISFLGKLLLKQYIDKTS